MISFEKINNIQAFVKFNGKRIGAIEKTIGGYLVEIEYRHHFYPEALKDKAKEHIEMLYKYSKGYISLGSILKRNEES